MRRRCRLAVLLLAVLLLAVAPVRGMAAAPSFPPGRYQLDPQHSRIAWSVGHLGFSIYQGLIPGVRGMLRIDPAHPEASRLDATVAMGSIGTLDPALDKRLASPQFFNTARYPAATYHADGLVVTGPRTARLNGSLTLCGVSHPVAMNVRFERSGIDPVDGKLTLGFEATAIVRRSLFGVTAYVPVVGDDVGLELEAELVPAGG